ncbi:MAG: DUF3800 domain-containing protein [Devosia sp.]
MGLQAYIDDSRKDEWFVLGGHIASAESWATFSREWEQLLPTHGTLAGNGQYHIKMTEMAMNDERMARVPAFYRVIEKHVICSISIAFKSTDLANAQSRIRVAGYENVEWGILSNPFRMAFRVLMDMFHSHREQLVNVKLPTDEKVDFYFDNQSEKGDILATWDTYLSRRAHLRDRFGAPPKFEDDKDFLPLQSADLWAWWVRYWNSTGDGLNMSDPPFKKWSALREDHGKIVITASEDEMVDDLLKIVRNQMPGTFVWDANNPPHGWG